MKAVFDSSYIANLDGQHVKEAATKADLARAVMDDIENFREAHDCARLVMVWCGSTEKYIMPGQVHETLATFEAGLQDNDPAISPSMIYAYASLRLGVPFLNGAPNLTCDIPALIELARLTATPIGGKDFKTGQTLMKPSWPRACRPGAWA